MWASGHPWPPGQVPAHQHTAHQRRLLLPHPLPGQAPQPRHTSPQLQSLPGADRPVPVCSLLPHQGCPPTPHSPSPPSPPPRPGHSLPRAAQAGIRQGITGGGRQQPQARPTLSPGRASMRALLGWGSTQGTPIPTASPGAVQVPAWWRRDTKHHPPLQHRRSLHRLRHNWVSDTPAPPRSLSAHWRHTTAPTGAGRSWCPGRSWRPGGQCLGTTLRILLSLGGCEPPTRVPAAPAPASSIPGRHPGETGHLTADGPQDRARVWMCRSGPSQEDSLTSSVIPRTQDSAIITAGPVLLWTWGCGGQRRARL
ncbi:caskin-2-like [Monodon monoceros]|uniref:caskin-2-like n=1 Tax=Monodon monoceros TaxID=40151 RepID=UPI0010F6A03A|nr:caskin-2-like [Monodon monoceros]